MCVDVIIDIIRSFTKNCTKRDPRGVSWANFARYVPLASQNPYPIMVSSQAIIIDPIF